MFGDIMGVDLAQGMAAAFLASAMTAYTGFGGGLILVPAFAILFGPIQGIAIAALCGVIGQAQLIPNAVRNARWREAGPLSAAILVSIPLGTLFLVSADPAIIKMGMGVFVLASAFLLMLKVSYRGPRGAAPGAITGLLTGGIMGTIGVPAGPLLVIYYLAASEPPTIQRANIVLGVFAMTAMMLISLLARGVIGMHTLELALFIAPASVIGAIAGRTMFKIAPTAWFKHVAHWLLVAIGIAVVAN